MLAPSPFRGRGGEPRTLLERLCDFWVRSALVALEAFDLKDSEVPAPQVLAHVDPPVAKRAGTLELDHLVSRELEGVATEGAVDRECVGGASRIPLVGGSGILEAVGLIGVSHISSSSSSAGWGRCHCLRSGSR